LSDILQTEIVGRGLRAGLVVWLDHPASQLADLAVQAEDAGFADVWVPDHYFLRDVYVTQALMAERTRRIGLGTGVAAVQLRHPALIASSAATIDELSGGRALIGIGPGGFEFPTQFGLRPPSPLLLMRDSVQVIRQLLAGGADHEGDAVRAVGSQLGWDARSIPIYTSGRGPRMIELAGELADGVIVHGLNPAFIDYVRAHLKEGAERAERPDGACVISVMLDVEIDDDEGDAIERLRPRCKIMAGGSYTDELIPVYGLDPGDVARLRAAVSGADADAGTLVTEAMVRTFAIGGSVSTIATGLTQLRDLGVGHVILKLGEGEPETTARQIELIRPAIDDLRA
jgi:5,10-methylenetetrahydromethanopterin reductase